MSILADLILLIPKMNTFYNSIQEHSAVYCGDELNADMSSSFGGKPRSLERGGCHLIRHGQKVAESGDPGLTELGKEQARKTAKFLKDKNISKIISSTYKRTRETAEIINKTLNVEIKFDDRLRERMNWGPIPNQSLEEFLKEWEYSNFHREFKPKAGISSLQSGHDALNVISEISTSLPDSNIAVITHGGVICDLLRNIFSDNGLRIFKHDFPEKLDKLIKECSITTLIKDSDKFSLKEIGAVGHLV